MCVVRRRKSVARCIEILVLSFYVLVLILDWTMTACDVLSVDEPKKVEKTTNAGIGMLTHTIREDAGVISRTENSRLKFGFNQISTQFLESKWS